MDSIETWLVAEGFDLLWAQPVGPDRGAEAAFSIAGKDGPVARLLAGGSPALMWVVWDPCPVVPGGRLRRKRPGLNNERIYRAEERLNDRIERQGLSRAVGSHVVATDNAQQALDYITRVIPEQRVAIETEARKRATEFRTPYPVIRLLSMGRTRRAKVELVDFHGTPAVCKTFRRGRERFLQREIAARAIGRDLPYMTRMLEAGSNYIVIEWVEDHKQNFAHRVLPLGYRLWPTTLLSAATEIIRFFRRRGYEYLDFTPANLLMERNGKVRVIDFEFLQKVHEGIDDTRGCYAWYKVPADFTGDLPAAYLCKGLPYRRWRRAVGVPLAFTRRAVPSFWVAIMRSIFSVYLAQRTLFRRSA